MTPSWAPGTAPKGKPGDESPHNADAGEASTDRVVVQPDERTRLLPAESTPSNRAGYLSPDDPAVSPYNLWSVRFMRYFTVAFLVSLHFSISIHNG